MKATLIDVENISDDVVSIGHVVKVLDKEFNEEVEYEIVGSTNADSLSGRISNESPLGLALLGRKIGEEAVVEAPDGEFTYIVLDIRKPN